MYLEKSQPSNLNQVKLGVVYFDLFQLITIFNLIAYRKKQTQFTSINISQKNTIVEIIRLIDKHLSICFPTMSRENFQDTFKQILFIPDNKEKSLIIEDQDPLLSKEKINNSRFNSHITMTKKKSSRGNIGEDKQMSLPNAGKISALNDKYETLNQEFLSVNSNNEAGLEIQSTGKSIAHISGPKTNKQNSFARNMSTQSPISPSMKTNNILKYQTTTQQRHETISELEFQYRDIFKFGDFDLMIPFEKLDDLDALQQIDLTYFQAKCREVLKHVYDNCFKNHKLFFELRNYLILDELNQNLVK